MIGNDVIDIDAARKESNWQRKGFLEKLFTVKEQEFIIKQDDQEVAVWILWSMKEAAYKIYNRQTGIRSFIPLSLHCTLDNKKLEGIVTISEDTYFTKTFITGSLIDTIAVTSLHDFNAITEVVGSAILKNEQNLPFVILNSVKVPASVSHHGRFKKAVSLFTK